MNHDRRYRHPHARRYARALGVVALLVLAACTPAEKTPDKPAGTAATAARIDSAAFGALPDGRPVQSYTLTNTRGITLTAITYGGIITTLRTPDRSGTLADIVLGYDTLDGYLKTTPYFGAIVGRYGNRIAKGRFTLDGATYTLATNNGANALHGGLTGFDKVLWRAEPFDSAGRVGVAFSYTSKDGEEGYPGTLQARVTYSLTDSNTLVIDYVATTDKATPVNLTQHTYFNLAGDGAGPILDHRVTLDADAFTPVDSTLIPTGVLQPVAGTPFDFRTPKAIGARIAASDRQLTIAGGYDHNFVVRRTAEGLVHAAHVLDPVSGRTLDVATTEPGIQFYTGNFLDGTITGKGGHVYQHRTGFCLETQHYPNSPNQPSFPGTILRPGSEYRSRTIYSFGVDSSGN